MSTLQYHAVWLALALAGSAVASGVIARRVSRDDRRRRQAEQALEALARYCEWLAAQRRTARFAGDGSALVQLRQVQQAAFPELALAMVELLAVHARMLDFLWAQQQLRAADPEAWLESDHDSGFLALWGEHRLAVHRLAEQLRASAGELAVDAEPESVFPV
ncbi:hypothetical protein PE066_06900 [Ramlibacter tataouinensis]|uniref:hypothetical protein n=1 Tax=Ramlibacter tataouinensis TaxID=94132 RepID=UPI0022F38A94|nr:hypothetical protein [Ramlibacter tataouinensis]WBY03255.1 hypothetical protein PE066_06900 [Ramlibacter tataouinensis]